MHKHAQGWNIAKQLRTKKRIFLMIPVPIAGPASNGELRGRYQMVDGDPT
jgi:hypothetical protein